MVLLQASEKTSKKTVNIKKWAVCKSQEEFLTGGRKEILNDDTVT